MTTFEDRLLDVYVPVDDLFAKELSHRQYTSIVPYHRDLDVCAVHSIPYISLDTINGIRYLIMDVKMMRTDDIELTVDSYFFKQNKENWTFSHAGWPMQYAPISSDSTKKSTTYF